MNVKEYTRMYLQQSKHWWYLSRRNFIRTFLLRIKKCTPLTILDAGCGTGANTSLLLAFGNVIGIDASLHAKKYYELQHKKFRKSDVTVTPFRNNSFDLVVFSDVLYHKRIHDPGMTLKEAYRILRPNGYILITDCMYPFLFGSHDVQNQARERFTKHRLIALIENAGFQIRRSSFMYMLTFPLFMTMRIYDKYAHSSQPLTDHIPNNLINRILIYVEIVENQLLRFLYLPFGSSMIILAQKIRT